MNEVHRSGISLRYRSIAHQCTRSCPRIWNCAASLLSRGEWFPRKVQCVHLFWWWKGTISRDRRRIIAQQKGFIVCVFLSDTHERSHNQWKPDWNLDASLSLRATNNTHCANDKPLSISTIAKLPSCPNVGLWSSVTRRTSSLRCICTCCNSIDLTISSSTTMERSVKTMFAGNPNGEYRCLLLAAAVNLQWAYALSQNNQQDSFTSDQQQHQQQLRVHAAQLKYTRRVIKSRDTYSARKVAAISGERLIWPKSAQKLIFCDPTWLCKSRKATKNLCSFCPTLPLL